MASSAAHAGGLGWSRDFRGRSANGDPAPLASPRKSGHGPSHSCTRRPAAGGAPQPRRHAFLPISPPRRNRPKSCVAAGTVTGPTPLLECNSLPFWRPLAVAHRKRCSKPRKVANFLREFVTGSTAPRLASSGITLRATCGGPRRPCRATCRDRLRRLPPAPSGPRTSPDDSGGRQPGPPRSEFGTSGNSRALLTADRDRPAPPCRPWINAPAGGCGQK